MFKKLTDFSYKRNWKEAVGFYLAYFLVGLILSGIAGGLSSISSETITFSEGFDAGMGIGAMVAVVYSLIISFIVLIQKKLYKNFWYVILALSSGLLAILGGLLLGLMISAFMTTRDASTIETPSI